MSDVRSQFELRKQGNVPMASSFRISDFTRWLGMSASALNEATSDDLYKQLPRIGLKVVHVRSRLAGFHCHVTPCEDGMNWVRGENFGGCGDTPKEAILAAAMTCWEVIQYRKSRLSSDE